MLEFDLPVEIYFKIFDYLNYIDIQSVALVCKYWFEICQNVIIQKKILLTICNIDIDCKVSPINIFQKSLRSYINLNLENINLDLLNSLLENIGDTIKSITFKKILFTNGSFYKAILNLKNIEEIRILNCGFANETFSINLENRNCVDKILSNVKILIFKEIECDSWPILLEIGPKLVKLQEFEISEYFYQTSNTIRYNTILSVIRNNSKTLRKLIIKDIDNVNFWVPLIELKEIYNKLERFDCEYVCWEPESAVCDFILNQNNLTHLNLSQSKALKDFDVKFIVDHLINLKTLNLDFCTKLTNESASYLFNLKNLEILTIYECHQITGDGLKNGLININTNNKFKKFRLSGLDINDEFIILLSKKLLNLEVLEIKYPMRNEISDKSVQAIIQNLINLREISLEGCTTITDFGITGFNDLTGCENGVSIKSLKNLEILDLCMCNITDKCIMEFEFYKLKSIAILFVPGITVMAMKNMIINCPNIECLDFQNDSEIDELLEYAIKNLKRLKYININRICDSNKFKNKMQYASVDRAKKKYFIHIDCECKICNNAKSIFINLINNNI